MSRVDDVEAAHRGTDVGAGGATLRDVAREAGVHLSTVSRVLNGQAAQVRIPPRTEERIREVAARLGYRRNSIALALRTGRTLVVGMVVPDIANLYQAGITRAAADVLAKKGFSLFLASTDDDLEHARTHVTAMLGARVDGLLYGVARDEDPVLRGILDSGTPVVLINRAVPDARVSSVVPDDRSGIHQAVSHLLELGHTRIVHVAGPRDVSSTVNRLEAFDEALAAAGLAGSSHFAERQTEEEGRRITHALLREAPETSAVVAGNDRLALGAVDAIRESGRSCPEDVSVVGFNDMPYNERFTPSLTTVRVSQHLLGELAAGELLALIADRDRAPVKRLVEPELVVRGSTVPPSH